SHRPSAGGPACVESGGTLAPGSSGWQERACAPPCRRGAHERTRPRASRFLATRRAAILTVTVDALPRDIGRFVIEGFLGAGGMANVYLGWQKPPMKREVAIKVIQERWLEEPGVVERFRREAANSARLDHENVVRVIDSGDLLEDGGRLTPYI